MSISALARIVRGILAITLSALSEIAARPAMTAPPPMQRKTVALSLEAVLTVALMRRRRGDLWYRSGAGDKGRQALNVAVVVFGSLLRMATAKARLLAQLFARLKELRIARQIGLWITGTEGRLLACARQTGRFVVHIIADVVTRLVATVHCPFATEEGSGLTILILRCGDEAEIVLRVLQIVLRRNRISRRLRIACKLQVFLGDVRSSASYFDIGSVRLVHPCERIVTLAVSPAHTLVLLISHD